MLYVLVVVMTLLGAIASALFKKATGDYSFKNIFFSSVFISGVLMYGLASLLNIYLLKYMDYSKLVPMISLSYIWSMIIANKYFEEKIGFLKITGLFFIIIGVILISQ